MERSIALISLLLVGSLSLTVGATQVPTVVEVEQLEDNLFVLRGAGGGGNTAVFVATAGVVVVDSKNPGWGPPLLEQINSLTSNPITTLINTHSHHDHVSGNVAFPAAVDFVAHETTKANMEVMRAYSGRTEPPANVFADTAGHGLPTRTFRDRMSLDDGGDRVDLYYFGPGHTGGDTWVVFPSLRTLHSGNTFPGKNLPFRDANNGGSGVEIGNSLQQAHDSIPEVDTIITGHSTQMTWADLNEYAAFNRQFLRAVEGEHAAGRSVEDIAGGWTMPSTYEGYRVPQTAQIEGSVRVIVNELDVRGGR